MSKLDINASASDIPLSIKKNITDALVMYRESLKKGLRICIPACVVSCDRGTRRVEVMPLVKYGYFAPGVKYKPRGNYYCTLIQNTHGGFSSDSPLYKGDTGWVITSDWSTEYIKQAGCLTTTVLKADRPDKVLENEYQSEASCSKIHDVGEGLFIPDSWANFEISRCKDTLDSLGSENTYIGSAFTTSDKYHPCGSFRYQLSNTCSISMSRDGILRIAHSIPTRNHTKIELMTETGDLRIVGIHEKKNNDEFELPLPSEYAKEKISDMLSQEPEKLSTKDSEKQEPNGEGIPGITKKWYQWNEKYEKAVAEQQEIADAEELEESKYDYGKEEKIKTRKTEVHIRPNKSTMEVSYIKWRPDEPEDGKEEEEEPGVGDGGFSVDRPWTKSVLFSSTPMHSIVEASYENILEETHRSMTVDVYSGGTNAEKSPHVTIKGIYKDGQNKIERENNIEILGGSESDKAEATCQLKYNSENESHETNIYVSGGDAGICPKASIDFKSQMNDLSKEAGLDIDLQEGSDEPKSDFNITKITSTDTKCLTCKTTTTTANFETSEVSASSTKSTKVDVTTTSIDSTCSDTGENKTVSAEFDVDHVKTTISNNSGYSAYSELEPGKVTVSESSSKAASLVLEGGDVTVTCDKFKVLASSESRFSGSDLIVEENMDIKKDAWIEGNEAVNGNATIDGNESVGGTLDVTDDTTINGLTTMNNSAVINGCASISDDLSVGANANIDGELTVEGDAELKSNTLHNGAVKIGGCRVVASEDESILAYRAYPWTN